MTNYSARYVLVFILLLIVCKAALGAGEVPKDDSEQGAWGDWGSPAYCPAGTLVWGFQLKSEPNQGSGDDTALNGIRLICKGVDGSKSYITSAEGKWGSWGKEHLCKKMPAQGFAIQVERYQGKNKNTNSRDDTAASNILLLCDTPYPTGDPPAAWGDWSANYWCGFYPLVTRVYGFRTKVEADQGGGDDTALNAMQVYCKPI
jgi:hypothetical protein